MTEEKVLRVPAKLENLDEALNFVGEILEAEGCSTKADTQLRIALEEMYINVARYAYPEGDGWVEIRCSVEDGVVTIKIIDGGVPFNPLENPDPDTTLPGKERKIGGLGIFMVKATMDEVEYAYRDDCNHFTMRRSIV